MKTIFSYDIFCQKKASTKTQKKAYLDHYEQIKMNIQQMIKNNMSSIVIIR